MARPNRFIAEVRIGEELARAHVKNTGRLKELLTEGAAVYLEDFAGRMGNRKLRYSLIAVEKNCGGQNKIVNIDSQAPNKVVAEALSDGTIALDGMNGKVEFFAEKTFGDSRFDFKCIDEEGKTGYIEVKGVTLEEDGYAMFPDAPTERGVKHIKGLTDALEKGFGAYIIFVIQMSGTKGFMPNAKKHPEFARMLRKAYESGVKIIACECRVESDLLKIKKEKINIFLKDFETI